MQILYNFLRWGRNGIKIYSPEVDTIDRVSCYMIFTAHHWKSEFSRKVLVMGKFILRWMNQDISATAKCFISLFLHESVVSAPKKLVPRGSVAAQKLQRHPCPTRLNTKYQPSRPASKRTTLILLQLVNSYQRLECGKRYLWKSIQETHFLSPPMLGASLEPTSKHQETWIFFPLSSPLQKNDLS